MRESCAKSEAEQHQARVGFSDWLGRDDARIRRAIGLAPCGSLDDWNPSELGGRRSVPQSSGGMGTRAFPAAALPLLARRRARGYARTATAGPKTPPKGRGF
jgi:hypothetical protein